MAAIFISFVHEDQRVAGAVKDLIESELKLENRVFLSSDKTQVYAGDVWVQKITDALKEAKLIVLMLSKRSVGRPWVNFEAGGGWLTDKKIIPCCYGNQQKDKLPHPYSALHAVDLPEDAYFLLQSIHHHLGLTTPRPESPLLRALKEGLSAKDKKKENILVALYGDPYRMLQSAISALEDEP